MGAHDVEIAGADALEEGVGRAGEGIVEEEDVGAGDFDAAAAAIDGGVEVAPGGEFSAAKAQLAGGDGDGIGLEGAGGPDGDGAGDAEIAVVGDVDDAGAAGAGVIAANVEDGGLPGGQVVGDLDGALAAGAAGDEGLLMISAPRCREVR